MGTALTALTLAGGYGTRMHPLTEDRYPKHLYEIAGKTIIEHSLEPFRKSGVQSILMLSYKAPLISERLENNDIESYTFARPLGVVAETLKIIDELKLEGDIIVAEGDSIRAGLDINSAYRQHLNSEAISTVFATSQSLKNSENFHGVVLDEESKVHRIRQPRDEVANKFPIVGSVIISQRGLPQLRAVTSENNNWSGMMEALHSAGDMYANVQPIGYFNINTPEAVEEVRNYLTNSQT